MPTLELAPPASVRAECARGIAIAASLPTESSIHGDAFAWAQKFSVGELATPERIRAIRAWHLRHGAGARRAKEGRDAALYALWGGDEGRKWADRVVKSMSQEPGDVHVPAPIGSERDETEMASEAVTAKAMPHEDLPVADGEWDADAAVKRLRTWAGLDTEVQTASARKKYSRGFAIVVDKGERLSDYRYPFCDIRGGKLVAVAKGVSSAIAALNGAHGTGGKGLSESERAAALSNLHKHQERWQEMQKKAASDTARSMRAKAFELSSTRLAANDLPAPGERDADGYLCYSDVQVAKVGTYKGHPAGAFEFTSDVFDAMVENHEANPNGIVPFDYEHGSEAMGTSVFQDGAPAVGWILSLKNRGDEGLYARVGWVDAQCVEYIRTGRYKFVSPAVVFDGTDPESGDSVGPVLVSAAVTNRPFLQGMRPLAARADGGAVSDDPASAPEEPQMTRDELDAVLATLRAPTHTIQLTADQAGNRSSLIESLRSIFGLPEMSAEADVLGALDRLEQLVSGDGGEKDGIDVGSIVESLRWCFRLPKLTSAADVIAYIRKGLAATQSTDSAGNAAATAARNTGGQPVSASTKGPVTMATAVEKSPEHAQLEKDHEAMKASYGAFKSRVCKAMKMDAKHEAAEDEIIQKIEESVEALEKLQQSAEAQAKAAAEADVEKVAARAKMTDAQKNELRTLRTKMPESFKALYAKELADPPAAPATPTPVDAATTLALMNTVGQSGGAQPSAIPDLADRTAAAAALSQKMHDAAMKLMSSNPQFSTDYGAALKHVASLVAAGQQI